MWGTALLNLLSDNIFMMSMNLLDSMFKCPLNQGGVVLLFVTLCLHAGYTSVAKKLSVEVGGAKRLHSLSSLVSAGILCPWACFIFLTTEVRHMLLYFDCVFVLSVHNFANSLNNFHHWHFISLHVICSRFKSVW